MHNISQDRMVRRFQRMVKQCVRAYGNRTIVLCEKGAQHEAYSETADACHIRQCTSLLGVLANPRTNVSGTYYAVSVSSAAFRDRHLSSIRSAQYTVIIVTENAMQRFQIQQRHVHNPSTSVMMPATVSSSCTPVQARSAQARSAQAVPSSSTTSQNDAAMSDNGCEMEVLEECAVCLTRISSELMPSHFEYCFTANSKASVQ